MTEYAVTVSSNFEGRIIKVQGILSRQTVTVPLGMVNNLVLYEPLLGRVLGWGHIDIETGNDYDGDRLEYVPDPRTFHQIWKTLLDTGYTGQVRDARLLDVGPYVDARPYGRIPASDATTARRSSSVMRRKR